MVIERTIQERRARLNCESLLAFNGVDQYADAGVNTNVANTITNQNDWTLCLIGSLLEFGGNKSSILYQGDLSVSSNKWSVLQFNGDFCFLFGHDNGPTSNSRIKYYFFNIPTDQFARTTLYTLRYVASSDTLTLTLNASLQYSVSNTFVGSGYSTSTDTLASHPLYFFTGALRDYTQRAGSISHVMFFDRLTSLSEDEYIHHYGGIVPASAHQACTGHYVADREGLVIWDVVEQYNYAKATPLTAYHATLQNFTSQQVDTETGTNSAYLGFYDKTIYRPYVDSDQDGVPDQPLVEKSSLLPPLVNALRFTGTKRASVAQFNPSNENGYTFIFSFKIVEGTVFTSQGDGLFRHLGSTGWDIVLRGNGTDANYITFGGSITGRIVYLPDSINIYDLHQLVLTSTSDGYSFYLDGRQIGSGSYVPTGMDENPGDAYLAAFVTSRAFQGNIVQTSIAKGTITPRQVIELWNNSLLSNPKASWTNLEWQLLPNFNHVNDDGAGNYTLTDNSPQNHTITLSGFSANNLDDQHPDYALTPINSLR